MTRHLTIDDLGAITVPSAPALSPGGKRIVYVVRTQDAERDRPMTALWIADEGADPRQLTQGETDNAPAWSPDGTTIAFLRAVDDAPQVFLLDVAGGEARQLTSLKMGAGTPVWSPDGAHIAFTAPVNSDDNTKETAPIVIDRIDYQIDGMGNLGSVRTQLHLLDVEAGAARQLTYGDELVDTPSWSPDGKTIAFTSGPDEGDQPLKRPIFTIDALDAKANARLAALADGYAGSLLWTKDGDALIVVGYTGVPKGHARLLRVSLASDDVTDLGARLNRNVMTGAPAYPGALPALIDDGSRVLFCVRDRGLTHLHKVDVGGSEPTSVLTGDGRLVAGMSVASGIAAVVLITRESFGEIVTIDLATGEETVRTDHGKNLVDVERYPHTERTFAISDGVEVHGWIISDPEQEGARPLLVDIHGGPHNAWNDVADEMHLYHQDLIARGWAVAILNPRGSDGYGEEFFTGVDGAWGVSDAKDFLEPIDTLVAEELADPKRLAVAGYSYGGYMTCYLTGHDDRFAAAVTGGVVADLVSMAGTGDAGALIGDVELGGYPWEAPEEYAAMSPFTGIGEVNTPTLVLQGEADRRCPVGQAQQWYGGVKTRGIPTELVLYPGGSHLFPITGPLSHRLDYNRRVLSWLERFAGDAAGARPAPIDAAHWTSRMKVLAERHGIVGAQLGILRMGSGPDEMVRAATGTLNKLTGAPVTTDSIFQIGSISKVWTATLVMQLIDEGKFTLDTPVIDVVPELKLKDSEAQADVTIWHLLTHTSGIDGDIFTDTGRGDDAVEKLVALLGAATQNHPLGASWSYCNAGYSLLGFVIQKVTGDTWEEAIQKRLSTPLGLTRTVTLAHDAIRYSVATGHIPGPDGETVPTPTWDLPRSVGPAGLIVQSTDELLTFVRMHLAGGVASDGTRVLSEESTAAMSAHQVDLPDKLTLGDSWGLGWIRFDWNGHRVFGHDGSTLGQNGFLRVLPEQNLGVTILVNGGNSADYFRELSAEIFSTVAGVGLPTAFAPPAEPVDVDAEPFLGTYERASVRMEVLRDDDGVLKLTAEPTGDMADISEDGREEYPLVAVSENVFAMQVPGAVGWMPVTFFELDGGAHYMHFGARATPLVGQS